MKALLSAALLLAALSLCGCALMPGSMRINRRAITAIDENEKNCELRAIDKKEPSPGLALLSYEF